MLAYFEQFVNSLNKPRIYLLLASFLLPLIFIILSNSGVLPLNNLYDFLFFFGLALILAIYRPGWSFLFFLSTILLENINLAPQEIGIMLRPYQLFGVVTILAILLRLGTKRIGFDLPRIKWADWAVVSFVVAGFLSAAFAPETGRSLKLSAVIFSLVLFYALTRIFIQNYQDIRRIIPFFLNASLVVVLYGIWQNMRFGMGLTHFETMPGRPNATFTEADWLGIFLAFLISILYVLIYSLGRNNSKIVLFPAGKDAVRERLFYFSLYFLLILSYILAIIAVSRSAWLGIIASTFVFLAYILSELEVNPQAWHWKKTGVYFSKLLGSLGMSLVIIFVFSLTDFELGNRFGSTASGLQEITVSCKDEIGASKLEQIKRIEQMNQLDDFNCRHIDLEDIQKEEQGGNIVTTILRNDPNVSIRSEIYKKSWEEIKTNPILGIGWGSINQILGTDERGAGLNSSNIFLEVWLGGGIVGFISFFIFFLAIPVRAIYLIRKNPQQRLFGLFLLLGFFSILVPNLFNAGIMLGFIWVFLAIAQAKKISQ